MTRLIGIMLLGLATAAGAGEVIERRPVGQAVPLPIDDPEVMQAAGIVGDFIKTRDTDGFERGIVRAAAAVRYESIYDFLALGVSSNRFSQGNWSLQATSIAGVFRNANRNTGEGVFARVGVTTNTHHTALHGEGTWNKRLSGNAGFEVVASRDAVESRAALESGTLANFLGVSFDYAPTDRLTLIGMPTYRRFTDGNEQAGARAWGIYTLLPEQGLSLMAHARTYDSSQNGGGAYFSPDQYDRAEVGFRLRHAFGGWRVFAIADVGRERINRDIEKPVNQLSLTATRTFEGGVSVGIQLVRYQATGEGAVNLATEERYVWRMGRLYFAIPLH